MNRLISFVATLALFVSLFAVLTPISPAAEIGLQFLMGADVDPVPPDKFIDDSICSPVACSSIITSSSDCKRCTNNLLANICVGAQGQKCKELTTTVAPPCGDIEKCSKFVQHNGECIWQSTGACNWSACSSTGVSCSAKACSSV